LGHKLVDAFFFLFDVSQVDLFFRLSETQKVFELSDARCVRRDCEGEFLHFGSLKRSLLLKFFVFLNAERVSSEACGVKRRVLSRVGLLEH